MTPRLRHGIRLAVVVFLCVPGARTAHGAGEQVGQIRGRIVEAATDLPVPGAKVTVSSPSLGDERIVITDENGEYLVPNLPIGHYTVAVSYSGVKPITRAILVQPGVTSPLDIKWSAELTEVETTTIVEQRPVTNPGSTQTGAVISYELQRHIPGMRDYLNMTSDVPGVRLDGRDPNILGGRQSDNHYLVDGLDTTDPLTRSGFRQRLSVESIEAQQLITGGFSAEYNALGGVINTITREGSDDWHARASFYTTNSAFQGRTPQGTSLVDYDEPFNNQPFDSSYNIYIASSIGGPILKHRLWFNATLEYRYEQITRLPGPPLNFPKVPEYRYLYWPALKVTWAPTPTQRLTTSFIADPSQLNNTLIGSDRLSIYRAHTDEGGVNGIVSWSFFPSNSFEFRVDAGVKFYYQHEGPQGWYGAVDKRYCDQFSPRNCNYEREAPTHQNRDDNSIWYNANQDVNINNRMNFQVDPKVTFRGRLLGEHATKIGLQLRVFRNDRRIHRPGYYKYDDRNGGPLEDGICDPENGKILGCDTRTFTPDRKIRILDYNPGLFFQDEWRLFSWLVLTPGIRFDYGRALTSNGTVFNSQFAVGPRIGFVLDLTRDQKTILSSSYGRSNEVAQLDQAANYDNSIQSSSPQERWVRDHWEPVLTTGGQSGVAVDRNAKVQHADQITTSFRREIFFNTVAQVEYTWKRAANLWGTIETNRIWDHSGFRVVDYRDGIAHTINLYTASDQQVRNFHGINFSVQGRPTPNWYFFGYYQLSWLYGTTENSIPAQLKFNNGYLAEDQRQHLSLAASYTFGFGLVVGTRMLHASGTTQDKTYNINGLPGSTNRRSPRGTDPGVCGGAVPGQGNFSPWTTACGNNIDLISEAHLPARTSIDLQLEFDTYRLLRQHLALTFEVFDLLNERSKNSIYTNDDRDGKFGYASGTPGGLSFRLGIRYDF